MGEGFVDELPEKFNAFYYGMSMHRVFTPGDILRCERIAFEDIRPGDIIYMDQRDGTRAYVHRAYQVYPDKIITFGDNRDTPDVRPLTKQCLFAIVRTVNQKNAPADSPDIPVPGGEEGLRIFRRHQRTRNIRKKILVLGRPILNIAFWRIPVTETAEFNGDTWFYYKSKPIGKKYRDNVSYLHWYYKLIYKIDIQRIADPE